MTNPIPTGTGTTVAVRMRAAGQMGRLKPARYVARRQGEARLLGPFLFLPAGQPSRVVVCFPESPRAARPTDQALSHESPDRDRQPVCDQVANREESPQQHDAGGRMAKGVQPSGVIELHEADPPNFLTKRGRPSGAKRTVRPPMTVPSMRAKVSETGRASTGVVLSPAGPTAPPARPVASASGSPARRRSADPGSRNTSASSSRRSAPWRTSAFPRAAAVLPPASAGRAPR